MKLNKMHGTQNRSRRNDTVRYIAVHYTGGTGSAKNNCIYFSGGNRGASADYFIDDAGIWEYNDPAEGWYTWAVGDGHGKYGITNANSVSIEVVNNGGPFSDKEVSHLRELTCWLMGRFNVPAERVVRHYDASRKECPAHYVDNARWLQLHKAITSAAPAKPKTPDYKQPSSKPKNDFGLWYRAHVQKLGWADPVRDGMTAGTTGQKLRLEAIKLDCRKCRFPLKLTVNAHIEGMGNVVYENVTHETVVGTVGKGKRLEGLVIDATGLPDGRHLFYRTHVQGVGWSDWVTEGSFSGSIGEGRRLEAFECYVG